MQNNLFREVVENCKTKKYGTHETNLKKASLDCGVTVLKKRRVKCHSKYCFSLVKSFLLWSSNYDYSVLRKIKKPVLIFKIYFLQGSRSALEFHLWVVGGAF